MTCWGVVLCWSFTSLWRWELDDGSESGWIGKFLSSMSGLQYYSQLKSVSENGDNEFSATHGLGQRADDAIKFLLIPKRKLCLLVSVGAGRARGRPENGIATTLTFPLGLLSSFPLPLSTPSSARHYQHSFSLSIFLLLFFCLSFSPFGSVPVAYLCPTTSITGILSLPSSSPIISQSRIPKPHTLIFSMRARSFSLDIAGPLFLLLAGTPATFSHPTPKLLTPSPGIDLSSPLPHHPSPNSSFPFPQAPSLPSPPPTQSTPSSSLSSSSEIHARSQGGAGKRGLAYEDPFKTSAFNTPAISWSYNWNARPPPVSIPGLASSSSVDKPGVNPVVNAPGSFVPMLWGERAFASWAEDAEWAIRNGANTFLGFVLFLFHLCVSWVEDN